ncbi:hypothetical protein [Bacteroides sp.]|uniref:hypothetical protein n=1 Tax=Bacteroides sp. TaxID=29523 RepID=UPI00262C58CC|nr:hypothetical protein [Bacteroides sp.]MDD3038220.1 hypothetical protein [Bacteroides sp.]
MNIRCLLLFVLAFLGRFGSTWAMSPVSDADSIFHSYFDRAIAFANSYPREKAYLHLDNTSYYVGDTIWFKAYVTLAEHTTPSPISKPLYVELLDQSGYVAQKHIVKLNNGEGCGQLILDKSFMSGFYEIRAYTRWMLAFDQPNYFSRVLPIYQSEQGEHPKQIVTNYDLNKSMNKRLEGAKGKLAIQFFPEGGSLVEGITSRVAFKVESKEDKEVQLFGTVVDKLGNELAKLETQRDGMGIFSYTPTAGKDVALTKVNYKGKEYSFPLPTALSAGYVMSVYDAAGGLFVSVSCNSITPEDDIAVFISKDGRPYVYKAFRSPKNDPLGFLIRTRDFPGGVYQITLLNKSGETLCERFCFVQPKDKLLMSVSGTQGVYLPYKPIQCEVQVTDKQGKPVRGTFSVAIRDAVRSDYAEYDNNLFTDMLLTSDLKGYIHQPGYYFTDITTQKLRELDLVMMIHGWRKYDMSSIIANEPPHLLQKVETDLWLDGQIKSSVLKKEKENLDMIITVKEDEDFVIGKTKTGEHGRFSIPIADFEGIREAIFQTSSPTAKIRTDRSVFIDRNFSPIPRRYASQEWYPQRMNKDIWTSMADRADSLYLDSISKDGEHQYLLDEVEITRKRKEDNLTTDVFEKSVDAYYYVAQMVDELRDKGKDVFTINEFMDMVNPDFTWNRTTDGSEYKNRRIRYIMNNHILSPIERKMMETEIDGIEKIVICEGGKAFNDYIIGNSKSLSNESSGSPFLFAKEDDGSTNVSDLDTYIAIYIIPLPYKDLMNKSMRAARGTRRTFIQGYTRPLEFYASAYDDLIPDTPSQYNRRTLYWDPSVETNEDGKAIINCYNEQYSNPIVIQVDMLKGGLIGHITYLSANVE